MYGESKTFAWLLRDLEKQQKKQTNKKQKWKFWLCIDYGQNVFQWTSKEPFDTTLDSLASLFSLRCLFLAKMVIFCVIGHMGYQGHKTIPIEMT